MNKHYIDYVVSLIPNPDNENYLPCDIWDVVRWCLVGIE
jgi:hypothetical protein